MTNLSPFIVIRRAAGLLAVFAAFFSLIPRL
jgi:hypothetical protein